MTAKTTSIISYCSVLGWFVAYFAGDKDGAKFHLNQALVLMIAGFLIGSFSIVSLFVGFASYLTPLLSLAHKVIWVICFIDACKGTETSIPVLSEIKILD